MLRSCTIGRRRWNLVTTTWTLWHAHIQHDKHESIVMVLLLVIRYFTINRTIFYWMTSRIKGNRQLVIITRRLSTSSHRQLVLTLNPIGYERSNSLVYWYPHEYEWLSSDKLFRLMWTVDRFFFQVIRQSKNMQLKYVSQLQNVPKACKSTRCIVGWTGTEWCQPTGAATFMHLVYFANHNRCFQRGLSLRPFNQKIQIKSLEHTQTLYCLIHPRVTHLPNSTFSTLSKEAQKTPTAILVVVTQNINTLKTQQQKHSDLALLKLL